MFSHRPARKFQPSSCRAQGRPGTQCWRNIFFLGVAILCAGRPVRAAEPATPNYFVRSWKTDSGLPDNVVTAIVQTRDGYLWLGTYGGLARFDGVRFTVFNSANTPELQSDRITSLFEDADGTLVDRP